MDKDWVPVDPPYPHRTFSEHFVELTPLFKYGSVFMALTITYQSFITLKKYRKMFSGIANCIIILTVIGFITLASIYFKDTVKYGKVPFVLYPYYDKLTPAIQ